MSGHPKTKVCLVIESTQYFTLNRVTKRDEKENKVDRYIKDISPEKKLFKEERAVDSDSEIVNPIGNNDLNTFKIVKTGNSFEKGYESLRRLFNKKYSMVTTIECNNSNQINLNSYTVIIKLI